MFDPEIPIHSPLPAADIFRLCATQVIHFNRILNGMSYGDGKYIKREQFRGLWDYLWWLQTIKHLAWGYFHSFHSLRYALLISNLVNCLQPQLLQSEQLQPSLLHATRPPNLTTSSGPFRVRMGCSSELKGTDVTVELSLWVVEIMGFAESEHVC